MDKFFIALSGTNIFKGLEAEAIAELLHNKPFRIKKFNRDEYIAYSHDVCHDLLFVVSGSVRGEMTDFTGKKLKIEDIVAPRPLAVAFVFGKENRFPVDIIASETASILYIPRDILIYLLQQNQIILNNYLNAISSRTQFLSDKIRFLSFKTIQEKIANYILDSLTKDSNKVVLNQSQTELADFFGVTRPSLARAMSVLAKEGILHVERREITILNREKLNKLVNKI
jgi:CRP-like cAMP-binding protein